MNVVLVVVFIYVFVLSSGRLSNKTCLRNLNNGTEQPMCRVSPEQNTVSQHYGVKWTGYCQLGLGKLLNCSIEEFTSSAQSIAVPVNRQACAHVYGQQYLYYSCMDRCVEPNVPCPLHNMTYDSCSYPNKKGGYDDAIHSCDNGDCVCDLNNDCEDGSDERGCINHFRCNTTGKLIRAGGVCNGIVECFDRSDECSSNCAGTQRIINNFLLRAFSWLAGAAATTLNGWVIVKNIVLLQGFNTRTCYTNTLLIILLALGDMLVGVYLLIIATTDFIYSDNYCNNEDMWLGSKECSLAGLISTIGSQMSLFTITTLSLYRVKMVEGEVSLRYKLKLVAVAMVITLLSVAVAIIPQIRLFEDYFINRLHYPALPLFAGALDKGQHLEIIQKYYGRVASTDVSWFTIRVLVEEMFTKDKTTVIGNSMGFYSNNGICFFKYFVNQEDHQKVFSLAILTLNSLCLLIITSCYILVITSSKSKNDNAERLQHKISLIIMTDLACWVPFVLTCLLHYAAVFDATEYYGLSSIIILPLNSVLNPLIYDGTLSGIITQGACSLQLAVIRPRIALVNPAVEDGSMAGVDGRRKVSTVKEDILPPAPTKVPPTLNTARRQKSGGKTLPA